MDSPYELVRKRTQPLGPSNASYDLTLQGKGFGPYIITVSQPFFWFREKQDEVRAEFHRKLDVLLNKLMPPGADRTPEEVHNDFPKMPPDAG
jgi:hypothetical protein